MSKQHDFSLGPAPVYCVHALRRDNAKITTIRMNDLNAIKREFDEMQRSGKYTAITADFGTKRPRKQIEPETLPLFE